MKKYSVQSKKLHVIFLIPQKRKKLNLSGVGGMEIV